MTHDELIERVARAIADASDYQGEWQVWEHEAIAAIRVVVEECARIAARSASPATIDAIRKLAGGEQ